MKSRFLGACILLLVSILVSCQSTDPVEGDVVVPPPPPATTPAAPPPPAVVPPALSQDMINALNAAKDSAGTNRALSLEVDGAKYFPNEWNAAESQYVQANETVVGGTNAEYQAAADNYNNIAAAFEKITIDALPLYAEDFRDKMLAERQAAIDAGILAIDPERFAVAEDYALAAVAAWEIQDYETAVVNARNAFPRYTALKIGANAYNVRVNIANHRFASYDNTAIDAADETAFRAITQYDEGNITAITTADKALSNYTTIYDALNTASDAYDVRMEIDYWITQAIETEAYNASIGIYYGDYSAYETALNTADQDAYLAIDQYDRGDAGAALVSARNALSEYNTLMSQAWVTAATITGDTAAGTRKTASDAKAPVAVKAEFDRAQQIYTEGQTFLRSEDYENAAAYFYQSIPLFKSAAELAEIKRQQAHAAILAAERKISESDQTATDAEVRLGGGAR